MDVINTVTGTCKPDELGMTLMHEHLLIGFGGWELDCAAPEVNLELARENSVARLKELRDLGVRTFVDPCPMDLGRNVEFMAEVSEASGVKIVCATGMYKEDLGVPAYFKMRPVEDIVEAYTKEIKVGIGKSGIKAGLLKCATGHGKITPYEENCLRAAARVHKATGVPITTHTDEGTMGREQLDIFASEGVALENVIIGHSCGSSDLKYHVDMLDRGATLGFDRFGADFLHPDKLRMAALIGLLGVGYEKKIVLSHDSIQCILGRFPVVPPGVEKLLVNWHPLHVFQNILPKLREAGVSQKTIDTMLIENPKSFFQNS